VEESACLNPEGGSAIHSNQNEVKPFLSLFPG